MEQSQRLDTAKRSLRGLAMGDAFGESFIANPLAVSQALPQRMAMPGRWPYTDDTVMAISIVRVLAEHGRIDQDALAQAFAEAYRLEPHRGYGGMAHRILSAMCEGQDWRALAPKVFGGQGSMGNGGGMRAAPIGAYYYDDAARVREEAKNSAEVTHAHPEGLAAAEAIALGAALAQRFALGEHQLQGATFLKTLADLLSPSLTKDRIQAAAEMQAGTPMHILVDTLGNGSSVLAQDTAPFALFCAAHHLTNFEQAMWYTLSGLGDMDTTCAMVGGIVVLSADKTTIAESFTLQTESLPAEVRVSS